MFIDLSVAVNEKTPVYPGDPETKIQPAGILKDAGYQDHYVSIGTHVGTHIDAPSHMIEGGKNLDEFPLGTFSGRGICIPIENEFDLFELQKQDIEEGDIVLFRTGMSEKYHSLEYYEHYPALPEEVATWLVGKKIKMVGVDTCSVDTPPFAVHKIFLSAEVLIIENLSNLAALPTTPFRIYAFPMKLETDGAPVRVVAEVG